MPASLCAPQSDVGERWRECDGDQEQQNREGASGLSAAARLLPGKVELDWTRALLAHRP